jgi:hypothetical protein
MPFREGPKRTKVRGSSQCRRRVRFDIHPTPVTAQLSTVGLWISPTIRAPARDAVEPEPERLPASYPRGTSYQSHTTSSPAAIATATPLLRGVTGTDSPASAKKQKTRTGVSAGPGAMSVSLYTPPGRCWKRAMPGPGLVSMMVVASCRPPGPAREKTEPAPR